VHRDPPARPLSQTREGRAAGARVPPMHYLDKPSRNRVSGQPCQTGVQFSLSKGVHFRMSLTAAAAVTRPADNLDLVDRRNDVEHLGDILADHVHGTAAARAALVLDIDDHLDSRQMRRQGTAVALRRLGARRSPFRRPALADRLRLSYAERFRVRPATAPLRRSVLPPSLSKQLLAPRAGRDFAAVRRHRRACRNYTCQCAVATELACHPANDGAVTCRSHPTHRRTSRSRADLSVDRDPRREEFKFRC
jgi:hypothetical protein